MRIVRHRALCLFLIAAFFAGCTSGGAGTTAATPEGSDRVDLVITTDRGSELTFVPASAAASAAPTLVIRFRNVSGQPHNLTFEGNPARTETIVPPGGSDDVELAAATPGDYPFVCTIHPSMRGVLTIR